MADLIQFTNGNTTEWNNDNPILAEGQLGIESLGTTPQTYKMKYGDGVSHWVDLAYFTGEKGADGISITDISRTSGDGSAGSIDVYTITYSDSSTTTFNVYNGADGAVYDDSYVAKFNQTNTWTAPQISTMTAITTGTVDTSVTNDFILTPTADFTIDFANIVSGSHGSILLDNSGGHTASKATKVKDDGDFLTTISTAGIYTISYVSNGTNVYVSYTGALS